MKRAIFVVSSFIAFFGVPTGASAQQSAGVICNPKSALTNVRSGPTAKGTSIIASLPNKTFLVVKERVKNPEGTHDWTRVEVQHNGVLKAGFVSSELISGTCESKIAAPSINEGTRSASILEETYNPFHYKEFVPSFVISSGRWPNNQLMLKRVSLSTNSCQILVDFKNYYSTENNNRAANMSVFINVKDVAAITETRHSDLSAYSIKSKNDKKFKTICREELNKGDCVNFDHDIDFHSKYQGLGSALYREFKSCESNINYGVKRFDNETGWRQYEEKQFSEMFTRLMLKK